MYIYTCLSNFCCRKAFVPTTVVEFIIVGCSPSAVFWCSALHALRERCRWFVVRVTGKHISHTPFSSRAEILRMRKYLRAICVRDGSQHTVDAAPAILVYIYH